MSISPDGCSVISSYNYKVAVVWDISYCTLTLSEYADYCYDTEREREIEIKLKYWYNNCKSHK